MYEFVKPLFPKTDNPIGFDVHDVAQRIGIHALHLKALLAHRVALTTEDAFRLAHYFGMEMDFWLNLQRNFEKDMLSRTAIPAAVETIVPHPKKKGVLVPVS